MRSGSACPPVPSEAQRKRWKLRYEFEAPFTAIRGEQLTETKRAELAEQFFAAELRHLDDLNADAEGCDLLIDGAVERLDADHDGARPLGEVERVRVKAELGAAKARRAALEGKPVVRPPRIDPRTLKPIDTAKLGLPFAEAAERSLAELQHDSAARLTAQTLGQDRAVYRLFDQWAGQPPLGDIGRKAASDFLAEVAKLDPHWGRSPETKRRSFREIMERFGNHPTGLANRTLNRYATALGMVWDWARKTGLAEVENPWSDQVRDIGEKRTTEKLPFTAAELAKLLTNARPEIRPERHTHEAALAWLMWIAAYSGMRLNEITALKVVDLRQAEGGVALRCDERQDGSGRPAGARPFHAARPRASRLREARAGVAVAGLEGGRAGRQARLAHLQAHLSAVSPGARRGTAGSRDRT